MQKIKKAFYIFSCVILGILLSFILHALIVIPIIYVMIGDFEKYSFGLSWNELMIVHGIFTILLFVLGLVLGIYLGFKWWKYIYVDRKYTGRLVKIK